MPYLLPENVPPDDLRCIKVWIPDDPEYAKVFWGQFHQLAHWWSHERDDNKTAAAVAMVWRECWEMSRDAYENGEECDDMTFERRYERPKPGEPWITQHRYAGETVWRDAHIQANWSGQSADIPEASDWPTAQNEAAGIMSGWHMWLARQFADGLTAGLSKAQTVDMIMGQIAPTTDNYAATRAAVEDTYDMVSDLPTPTATMEEFAEDECKSMPYWQTLFNAIEGKADNWLDEIADYMETRLGNDLIAEPFNKFANRVAQTLIPKKWREFWKDQQEEYGESGFAAECEWIHTIDLTVTMSPFFFNASYPGQPTWPGGYYDPGNGVSGQNIGPQPEDLMKTFSMDFFFKYDTKITRVLAEETTTEPGSNRNVGIALDNAELCGAGGDQTGWDIDFIILSEGACDIPHTRLRVFGYSEFGQTWMTSITIRGNGPNPFGSEDFEL